MILLFFISLNIQMFNENYRRPEKRFNFKNAPIKYKPPNRFDSEIKRPTLEFSLPKKRKELISNFYGYEKPTKIDLAESTIAKFLEVKEKDPDDKAWLNEKTRITNRLTAAGQSRAQIEQYLKDNPPLGRQQYTRNVRKPIGSANLGIDGKLKELSDEIKSGNINNNAAVAAIVPAIISILDGVTQDLTQQQQKHLNTLLAIIPTNLTPQDLNIPSFMDKKYIDNNRGAVLLHLINSSKAIPGLDINNPAFGISDRPVSVRSLLTSMKGKVLVCNNPLDPNKRNYIIKYDKDDIQTLSEQIQMNIPKYQDRAELLTLFSPGLHADL